MNPADVFILPTHVGCGGLLIETGYSVQLIAGRVVPEQRCETCGTYTNADREGVCPQ